MIEANDVYTALCVYKDIEMYSVMDVMPSCRKGLDWVKARLRDGVDPDDPLITETAAALARYFFFMYRFTESDKYENCKVGDITYKRNIEKEFKLEKQLRQQAIADAAAILKDGGFYCRGR